LCTRRQKRGHAAPDEASATPSSAALVDTLIEHVDASTISSTCVTDGAAWDDDEGDDDSGEDNEGSRVSLHSLVSSVGHASGVLGRTQTRTCRLGGKEALWAACNRSSVSSPV
jgi:hypothetical protein